VEGHEDGEDGAAPLNGSHLRWHRTWELGDECGREQQSAMSAMYSVGDVDSVGERSARTFEVNQAQSWVVWDAWDVGQCVSVAGGYAMQASNEAICQGWSWE
jgi:hypothetical protein